MKKCIISLSFDDGRYDNYEYAFKILKKYSLRATFHVITGYIDNSIKINDVGSSKQSCSLDNLKEMQDFGCEISSHGNDHTIVINELKKSLQKLKQWNFVSPCGFSIPHSNENIYDSQEFKEMISNNDLCYVRSGKNLKKLSLYRKINYVLYRIFKAKTFYYLYNCININYACDFDKYRLASIPVKRTDDIKSIKYLIDKYKSKRVWIILMFHSIVPNVSKDNWDWSIDKFDQLCLYLTKLNKDIDVLPIIEVVKNKGDKNEN